MTDFIPNMNIFNWIFSGKLSEDECGSWFKASQYKIVVNIVGPVNVGDCADPIVFGMCSLELCGRMRALKLRDPKTSNLCGNRRVYTVYLQRLHGENCWYFSTQTY
jgi:hypothetical protein